MRLYKSLLILVLLSGTMAYAHNDTIGKRQFSGKTVHSFTIQYNNVIRPKGHFDYHCDPSLGWAPLISYGNEFSLSYQFTTKSGFGGRAPALSVNRGHICAALRHPAEAEGGICGNKVYVNL